MLLVWWYTTGLTALLQRVREHVRSFARSLNLAVLTRYLFVPMYGYYDWASRTISFCVRLVQLIVVSLATIVYIAFELIVIIFWIVLPPVIVGNIIYQLLLWANR